MMLDRSTGADGSIKWTYYPDSMTAVFYDTGVNAVVTQVPIAKPEIEKVIYNQPATIVFWSDHTKTVVKCEECPDSVCQQFCGKCSAYKRWRTDGLLNAIAKKMMGSRYIDALQKWC